MPQGRIQPRTWFVKFRLSVCAEPAVDRSEHAEEQPTDVPLLLTSDSGIRMCIKEVMDRSNQGGQRIRSLQHVSFAYSPRGPADSTLILAGIPANIVDVVGFIQGGDSGYNSAFVDSGPTCHRPAMDSSLCETRHRRQLVATRYHPAIRIGLRLRSPRPRGLVVEWRPVRTGRKGRAQKTSAPRRCVRWGSDVGPRCSKEGSRARRHQYDEDRTAIASP